MNNLRILQTGIAGWQLIRSQPLAYIAWTLIFMIVSGLNLYARAHPSWSRLGLMNVAATVMAGAAIGAAIYRAVLRPADRRVFFLAFGADEVRVMVVNAVMLVGALAPPVVILGTVTVLEARFGGGERGGSLLGWMAILAIALIIAGLAVRLSLAAPMTFAEGRFRLLDSWRLTRGRFWPLLGAYGLALVPVLFIATLNFMLATRVRSLARASAASGGPGGFDAFVEAIAPVMGLELVIEGLAWTAMVVVLTAPAALAYRTLVLDRRAVPDVFA